MSCYWDIEFSAIGPNGRTRELECTAPELKFDDDHWKELSKQLPLRNEPKLSHHVETYKLAPGFVAIHACGNLLRQRSYVGVDHPFQRSDLSGGDIDGRTRRILYTL